MENLLASPLLNAFNSLQKEPQLSNLLASFSTRQEIQRLTYATTTFREVVRDAKVADGLQEEAMSDQLDKLAFVAYDVSDLLQEWRARAGIKVLRTPSRINQVLNFIFHHQLKNQSPTLTIDDLYNIINLVEKLGENVNKMKQMLEAIVKERVNSSIEDISLTRSCPSLNESKITLGRDQDQNVLVNLLLNEEDHHAGQEPTLVFIQGVEGVGKTTLAQSVLDDQRVQQHFDFKLWVLVSDVLDVKMVWQALIKSATGEDPTKDDEWAIVLNVYKLFLGKKYLLVLDDVRKVSQDSWKKLMYPLSGGGKGAKILVTSRNTTIPAISMAGVKVHLLKPLFDETCWTLLQRLSSNGEGDDELVQELEDLGREIARKCRGIPLIARRIGKLMSRKTRRQWEVILNSEGWKLPDMVNSITLIELEASYYNLPAQLRQFFSFWALSPNNRAIAEDMSVHYISPTKEKDLLVNLWTAQCCISTKGHQDQMEGVGATFFNELLRLGRSLFKDSIDNKKSATSLLIEDIVLHDQSNGCCKLKEEATQQGIITTPLHVLVDCGDSSRMRFTVTALLKAKKLRTVVFFGRYLRKVPKQFFEQMVCLRALDLSDSDIRQMPDSLGNLKLLRYLNLSKTAIKCLPETTSSLYLMRTMKLECCRRLQALPKDLRKLTELRHLEIRNTPMLRHLPQKIGSLTCLSTLSKFVVGNVPFEGIAELRLLDQLKGELRLENLERVKNADEATAAGLDRKSQLTNLLFIYNRVKMGDETIYENVLEALKPPCANLQSIQVNNYMGNSLPLWLEGLTFSHLVNISLFCCLNCKKLPAFGAKKRYPKLKTLTLSSMLSLEEFTWNSKSEESGPPCLAILKIIDCPKLRIIHCQGMLPSTLIELELCINAEETDLLLVAPPSVESLTLHFSSTSRRWKGPFPHKLPNLKCLTVIERAPDELLISSFPQFTSELTLVFKNCYEMFSLPEGFLNLTSVKELVLEDCCYLREERCKPGGSEYNKIRKIPTLHISSRPYYPV